MLDNVKRAFGWALAPKDSTLAMRAGALAARELKNRTNPDRADVLAWAHREVARRRNPRIPDITDVQPFFLWDRVTAAAAAVVSTTLQFFTSPLGNSRTKLDTNLKKAGELPSDMHFLVMAMRFIFDSGMNASDVILMNKSYYLEFEIGSKVFAEGHFDLFPGGAGIDGFAPASTAAAGPFTLQNNGIASPLATNNWGQDHGIHILQTENFVVRALAPVAPQLAAAGQALTPGLNLRCVLDGMLYRGVQ